MRKALLKTNLKLPNKRAGKVRDIYDCPLPDGSAGLLIIATDRVSAFDVVMANGIPGKGILLTQVAAFWFQYLSHLMRNHLVSLNVDDIPGLNDIQRRVLKGRIMLCQRCEVVPVECIGRGYLAGSGLKDYQRTGKICGVRLPAGMVNGSQLEALMFTPSTKAETGHDVNISYQEACDLAGQNTMNEIRLRTLILYFSAYRYAQDVGLILADTKLEFGYHPRTKELILIDEIFTPDSSRFWSARLWEPGKEQESFDKQYVRNYLQELVDKGDWNKKEPGPELPEDIIENTLQRYQDVYKMLTSRTLRFLSEAESDEAALDKGISIY